MKHAALIDHHGARYPVAITLHVVPVGAELGDHPGDDPLDLAGDAEDHSGLQRLDGVLGDHRARPEQLDLAQLGAAPAERLERDLDARGDRAADVLPRAR